MNSIKQAAPSSTEIQEYNSTDSANGIKATTNYRVEGKRMIELDGFLMGLKREQRPPGDLLCRWSDVNEMFAAHSSLSIFPAEVDEIPRY